MRKILIVATMGFLLLLSASTVSAAGADDVGIDDSTSSSSSSSEFSTSTDSRKGASKPEDGPEFEDRSGGDDDTKSISGTHSSGHEGIWNLDGQGTNWVGVTVSSGKIILLKYEPDQLSSALAGSIVGSIASLGFATDATVFAATFTLVTSTTATLTVLKCTPKPGLTCSFPTGTSFGLTKVFE